MMIWVYKLGIALTGWQAPSLIFIPAYSHKYPALETRKNTPERLLISHRDDSHTPAQTDSIRSKF